MRLLAAIVALAAIPAIAAEPLTGKVVSVTDGDTVRVLDADSPAAIPTGHVRRLRVDDPISRGIRL